MTKEEFWQKWTIQAYGGHAPHRILQRKEEFINDLDLIIQDDINRQIMTISSTVTCTLSPTVSAEMEGLGHEWAFPIADSYQTAYCYCTRCGVDSEDKLSVKLCKGK